MKSIESQTANPSGIDSCTKVLHSGAQFMAVRDSRNRRVSGLCTRNGRFYAVLWADRGDGRKGVRRFPLLNNADEPIRTLTEAKDALDVLKAKRREEKLPAAGRRPLFADFAKEYLVMAFKWAHEADPAAELYYNDYNLDANDNKRATAIELVKYLRENGATIHGIGMQGHYNLNSPTVEKIDETIGMFEALGLKVHITELDVRANAGANAALTGAVGGAAAGPNPARGPGQPGTAPAAGAPGGGRGGRGPIVPGRPLPPPAPDPPPLSGLSGVTGGRLSKMSRSDRTSGGPASRTGVGADWLER